MARRITVIDDDERQDADTTPATDHAIAEAAGRLCSLPTVFLPADPPRHSRVAFVLDPDGAPAPLPAEGLNLIRYSTNSQQWRSCRAWPIRRESPTSAQAGIAARDVGGFEEVAKLPSSALELRQRLASVVLPLGDCFTFVLVDRLAGQAPAIRGTAGPYR